MTEGLNWSGLVFVLIAASSWSFCIGSYIRMSWGNGHILRVLRYCKQGFVNYGPWVRFDPLLVFKQTTIRTVFTFLNHWLGSIVWQRPYVVCKAYNSYCLAFYKTSVLPTNPPFLLLFSHSVMFDSLWLHGLQHARLPCPWNFSRQILEWVAIS